MTIDVALISNNSSHIRRLNEIASEFNFKSNIYSNIDQFADGCEKDEISCIILSANEVSKQEEIAGQVQVIKQLQPNAFIITIIGKKMSSENAVFVKKSGSRMILQEQDLLESSKLEYVCTQMIRASLVPVKAAEFSVNTEIQFTLYYVMPLNKKIVPFVPKGTKIDEPRYQKMLKAGELLLKREEIDAFKKYLDANPINSAEGLLSRCRASYLNFCKSHVDLIFLLIDQSEKSSFQLGDSLFKYCESLAQGLLTSLSAVEDPWQVINNSSLGEFGPIERAPSVAAYSGVLSLMSSIGEPAKVMIAALIADIGMLDLSPQTNKKMRENFAKKATEFLTPDELTEYQKHPEMSLNICLARKLQIGNDLRNMIMCSHERADGKGFPQKTLPDNISHEAMLIQFSEMIDQKSSVRLGQEKITAAEARTKVYEENLLNKGTFDLSFLQKLKF